jgi:hypothetical protein
MFLSCLLGVAANRNGLQISLMGNKAKNKVSGVDSFGKHRKKKKS